MDENSNKGPGEREPQQPEAAKTSAKTSAKTPADESAATSADTPQRRTNGSHANDSKLPVVWSPKLDAEEGPADQAPQSAAGGGPSPPEDEAANTEANGAAATAAASRSSRFAMLAASVAFAAALGSFVGSLSASGLAHFWPSALQRPPMAQAHASRAIKAEMAQLSALESNLDAARRGANNQFAKLADRLDRIERTQLEPATKIAHLADAIDRLEKRTATAAAAAAAAETTGSIATGQPAATSAAKLPDKVLPDWIVRGVDGGRALVESRYGGIFDVGAGSVLPGLGRVEAITRQHGEWIVVTARGIITSDR